MNALERLNDKISQWKSSYEALQNENEQLRLELTNAAGSQGQKDSEIERLRSELEAKDVEIEKIIAQVESLLS